MEWEEVTNLQLSEIASDMDVLYQTRIQKERFADRIGDYEAAKGKYIVDQRCSIREIVIVRYDHHVHGDNRAGIQVFYTTE